MRLRVIACLILMTIFVGMLAGCGDNKNPASTEPPLDGPGEYTPPDLGFDTTTPDGTTPDGTTPDSTTPNDVTDVKETYLENDFTMGIPMSTKFEFSYIKQEDIPPVAHEEVKVIGFTDVFPAIYSGFFTAVDSKGNSVLLSPDMKVVVFPEGDFVMRDPIYYEGKVYFRVTDATTNWKTPREEYHNEWWLPRGGYAVVDAEGNEVIEFGVYSYIDAFVEGKARVKSDIDKKDYIIAADGTVLQEFTFDSKTSPYKLFPDGYIYFRTDEGRHAHFVTTWDGKVVIPSNEYKDDIFPKYLGNHVFVVYDGVLISGAKSGTRFYYGPGYVSPPPEQTGVIFDSEGMVVIGRITNGLVGALAKWEHEVRDVQGKRLVAPGRYIFKTGWGGGYALAQVGKRTVLLDMNFKETEAPDGVEIIGRYANDEALFVVKVTQDFRLYRYASVPARYENPIGVMDGEFNWVIPPGEIEYLRELPLESVAKGAGYSSGNDDEDGKIVLITRK